MKSENLITTGIALGVTSWPGSIPQPLVFSSWILIQVAHDMLQQDLLEHIEIVLNMLDDG